jgi:hypothetical protein
MSLTELRQEIVALLDGGEKALASKNFIEKIEFVSLLLELREDTAKAAATKAAKEPAPDNTNSKTSKRNGAPTSTTINWSWHRDTRELSPHQKGTFTTEAASLLEWVVAAGKDRKENSELIRNFL